MHEELLAKVNALLSDTVAAMEYAMKENEPQIANSVSRANVELFEAYHRAAGTWSDE